MRDNKYKILIITPYFPYPLNSGGNQAQYIMLEYLENIFDITYVCLEAPKNDFISFSRKLSNIKVIVVNFSKKRTFLDKILDYIFNPKKFFNTLLNFLKINFLYQNIPAIPEKESMHFSNIDQQQNFDPKLIQEVTSIISNNHFDIFQIEFSLFLPLVSLLPDNSIKVFIHHEVGFVRAERELATLNKVESIDNYIVKNQKVKELSYLRLFTKVITFSEIDKKYLIPELNSDNVIVSPFSINLVSNNVKVDSFSNLVFLGGEGHYPNKDAVEWFICNVFIYLSDIFPELKLKIIGNWTKKTIKSYKSYNSIQFLGYVEDLESELGNSVLVVPLRIGSGIRAKVLEAFSFGLPIISSSIGIEGIPVISGRHFLLAENLTDYVNSLSKLIEDPQFKDNMISNAKSEILPLFDIERCGSIRSQFYLNLINN